MRKLGMRAGAVKWDLYPTFGATFFQSLGRKGFMDRCDEISDYNQDCMAFSMGWRVEFATTDSQSNA